MRFTKQRNKNCVKLRRLLFSNVLLLGWLSCSDLATASDTVGPLVGTVDATSARLLYRADASEQPLRLTLLLDGKVIRQVTVSSKKEDDYVAKFEFKKLQPATQYHYRIDSAHSQKTFVETDEEHTFMTANPKRLGHRVSVGFVSCVDIEPNRIWKEMEDLGLDTICLLGDTPYIDKSDLEAVRARHRDFLQQSDLATLAAHTPIVGTWDDHDFGRNNGNGRNMMNGKRATRRGFVNYRAHSQYGTGSEGIYHTIDLGMIEVFLLDPRYFSQIEPSPVDETKPTCFGPQQWNWLLAALRDSKAPFKVLAMGAIWQDKKNRETDDMFTYWYERDALLDIVKNEQISGVVLLGGDIHVARHLIHPQRVGYDLHDFVISPGHKRTITELDVYHPSLEWSLVEGWQFLTLTADGSMESPTLTAEYRQPDGVVNRKVEIPLKSLTSNNQPSIEPSLRAHWSFDRDLKNRSALNRRIDAVAMNGAKVESDSGVSGGALKLERSRQQFVNVSRSFLDETSTGHTVSLWFKPSSLPAHGSPERHFLLESTAEGKPIAKQGWHLSPGLRAAETPDKVNLQLYTHTLHPAAQPEAAPSAKSQGGFDALIDRTKLTERWSHVAFTFDAKSITLCLDGQQIAKHTLPVPGPASEFGGLVIGGHRAGTGRNFDGLVDEVSVWQGAMNQAAIRRVRDSVLRRHSE